MMKLKNVLILGSLISVCACREIDNPVESPQLLRISPIITKATDVDFEDGDRIGMTMVREDGSVYAANVPLTCSEGVFSGDLYWYLEPETKASLSAYYPYMDAGTPTSFTVASDQSAGIGGSDLIVGTKKDIYPTKNVVDMVFRHQLTKIRITVCNQTGGGISSVILGGSVPTAKVDVSDGTVEVDSTAAASDIVAHNVLKDTVWNAIVVPQRVAFDFKVVLPSGKVLTQRLKELEIRQSFQYAVSAVVYKDDIKIVTSGQIQDWLEGGDISGGEEPGPEPGPEFEEHLEDGYFIYHDAQYSVAKMADGKWWMTSNMRYVPEGFTPCSDLKNVTAGIYCPIVVNSDRSGAEFSSDENVISANGYLYQSETALGLKVGDIVTIEDAVALEGAQGLCPAGWHVPTVTDIVYLVGKVATYKYPEGQSELSGAYYDEALGNAPISALDADGFNAAAWGAVAIQDNTRTSGTFVGWLKSNPSSISSGFLCGSSYAGSTLLDSSDPSKGYKNFQFWAFIPMSGNGTFNGGKLSYRMAAPLRCVRDSAE